MNKINDTIIKNGQKEGENIIHPMCLPTPQYDLCKMLSMMVVPVGAVMAFAMQKAPEGWLVANGAEISRLDYSALYDAIGDVYGAGDGVNTFNLPDLRGEFVRGFDSGRGVDEARAFGSFQDWAIENITGNAGSIVSFVNSDGLEVGAGALHGISSKKFGVEGGPSGSYFSLELDASRVVKTAQETRPRNIAMLYCIKYV